MKSIYFGTEKEKVNLETILQQLDGILTSGQGSMDYSSSAFYGGWKGRNIEELFSLLTEEEKKQVWEAFSNDIVLGDGDGTYPPYEVEFIGETLGYEVTVVPATFTSVKKVAKK